MLDTKRGAIRLLPLAALVCVLLQPLNALSLAQAGGATAAASAADRQPALLLLTQDFPPYVTLAEGGGQPQGPMVEAVREICRLAALNCDIRAYPWARAQLMVREGRADGAFPVALNEERAALMQFSPVLVEAEYGLFVRGDNPLAYRRPDDANGYTLAVYGPSNTSLAAERVQAGGLNIRIDMQPVADWGFQKLAAGRVDAVFSNRLVGEALLRRLKLGKLRYAGTGERVNYHVGLSRKSVSPELAARFSTAAATLVQSGAMARLMAGPDKEAGAGKTAR